MCIGGSNSSQNQVALLTGAGSGAIATIRLCGPDVAGFLQRYFSRPVKIGRCVHGLLRDGERIIDDPVIVRGNDNVIDINPHGGNWVVRSVIEQARADGFEHVDAGRMPLPEIAVDGPTQIWSEVLAHLPLVKTELGVRMLLAQPAAWEDLQRRITTGQMSQPELQRMLDDRSARWLLHPPIVAIVGPPNVGKSTLANQLFAQERSITADLPGTTRDWVGEIANVDGLAVMLMDTPGVRSTDDKVEQAAILAAAEQSRTADWVMIVLDQSTPLGDQEQRLIGMYPGAVLVANKSDEPSAWDAMAMQAISTVATTGHGIDTVRSAILRRFGCESLDPQQPRIWTDRQRDLVQAAWHRLPRQL